MSTPTLQQYCGVHAIQVFLPTVTLWFSYQTLVAFKPLGEDLVISANGWAATTGRHLNAIDSDKIKRIPHAEVLEAFAYRFDRFLPF